MISASPGACSVEPAPADSPAAATVPCASQSRRRSTILFVILVIVISALPFLPALRYGFVYDDDVQVVDTVAVRSVQSPANYFFTSVWTLRNSAIPLNYNYYRPLFYSLLRVSAALFGVHPLPWHLAVLITHLAVTVLVFFLLRRHLGDSWTAVAGSLVFGLHPVHTESVVWISGVTDPLVALGVLESFLLWLRKMETPSNGLLAGSLACYGAALMCKETAVALPAIVFAYVVMGIPGGENASPRQARQHPVRFARDTAVYSRDRFLLWSPPGRTSFFSGRIAAVAFSFRCVADSPFRSALLPARAGLARRAAALL